MAKFGFGLISGIATGILLSRVKTKNNETLGSSFKKASTSFFADARTAKQDVDRFKAAKQNFSKKLPATRQTIKELKIRTQQYQEQTRPTINEINSRAQQLNN